MGLRQRLSDLGRRYSCVWRNYQVAIYTAALVLMFFVFPLVFTGQLLIISCTIAVFTLIAAGVAGFLVYDYCPEDRGGGRG